MTAIFMLGVFVVDLGLWVSERRVAQTDADMAAMAGAVSLSQGQTGATAVAKAQEWATKNGYTQGVDSATVIVNWPYCGPDGTGTCDNTKIEVKASKPAPLLFASIFKLVVGDIGARAVGSALTAPKFYALFAHGDSNTTDCSGGINLSGGNFTITGATNANGYWDVSGTSGSNPVVINGQSSYVCKPSTVATDQNTTVTPLATPGSWADWPVQYSFPDFEQHVAYTPPVVLSSGVSNSAPTLPVSVAGIVGTQIILVDNEAMLVTGVAGNVLTVTRGCCGTTAVAHSAGAAVTNACTYSSSGNLDLTAYHKLPADPGYSYTLQPGVYCAAGQITCKPCDNTDGNVTLVSAASSGHAIDISAKGASLSAYLGNHVLAFSMSSDIQGINFSYAGSHWDGLLVNESGGVTVTGGHSSSGDTSSIGAILAQTIVWSGGHSSIQAAYVGGSSVSVALIE
jgi:hypothetical protein